jgi:hypothetical protein
MAMVIGSIEGLALSRALYCATGRLYIEAEAKGDSCSRVMRTKEKWQNGKDYSKRKSHFVQRLDDGC